MSVKRTGGTGRSSATGGDTGAKIGKEDLFEELKRLGGAATVFTPVDVSLAIGAGEPAVSRALLGLAAEGVVEKVDAGRYRSVAVAELSPSEFLRIFSRASKIDSTRIRDLSEIDRLKKNNDIMRGRLIQAQAERDHYLATLKTHGIDPGVPPSPPAAEAGAIVVAPPGPSNP